MDKGLPIPKVDVIQIDYVSDLLKIKEFYSNFERVRFKIKQDVFPIRNNPNSPVEYIRCPAYLEITVFDVPGIYDREFLIVDPKDEKLKPVLDELLGITMGCISEDKYIKINDVRKIIEKHLEYYPTDIFSEPKEGSPVDCYSAAGCRLFGRLVLESLDEYEMDGSNE